MKRFIIPVFLLTVFIIASCSTKQTSEEYFSYKNPVINIEVSYPASWDNTDIDDMIAFFRAPEKDGFSASFGIFSDEENQELTNKTQKEYFDENKDLINDFKILSFTKTTFAGEDCIIAVFDSAGDNGKTRQKQYLLNHNGKLYMLVFTAAQSNYKDYEPSFKKIEESFAFTN